jgi:hypothetical protein
MVSPDSQATACLPSGRNSTYRPVQISEAGSLVGERGNELLMLLVLSLNNPPYCINAMGHMDILQQPFDRTPVLSYGTNYTTRVDHAGDCESGGIGNFISAHGSYVMTANDDFICCKDNRKGGAASYYDLKTGNVRSEPGSERAVFARWELALKDEPPTVLFQVQANKSPDHPKS